MGNCYKVSKSQQATDIEYRRIITLQFKDSKEKIKFIVKPPEKLTSSVHTIGKVELRTTSCLLEGIDPRGTIKKPCQDLVFVTSQGDFLLSGVFDGHGKYGKEVVTYCTNFIINFFNSTNFSVNVKDSLTKMIEECDKALITDSNIDCSTSGSTAALLLITPETMWACSVGDSRAILATLPKHQKQNTEIQSPKLAQYKKTFGGDSRHLKTVQLTLDQKPNISYELERVIKAGGVVSQVTSKEGKKIGPYRIWKQGESIPGLAMSRSLGDSIAKSIGVISKPIIYQLNICLARDQFVVLATDGVWDVMTSAEVIQFVDRYKEICPKFPEYNKNTVSERNSIISELLCEEARHKWLDICKEDDVGIDDISAVIIQFNTKELDGLVIKRKGITAEQSLDIPNEDQKVIKVTKRFDIRRGSNAVIVEENEDNEEDFE